MGLPIPCFAGGFCLESLLCRSSLYDIFHYWRVNDSVAFDHTSNFLHLV